jgi:hypothetical protein
MFTIVRRSSRSAEAITICQGTFIRASNRLRCFIEPAVATRAFRNLFARPGPMAEKQNQRIQNQKCVHQCFAGFALLAG